MTDTRNPTADERALLSALLEATPASADLVDVLGDLRVAKMADGQMGSLLLIPKGADVDDRKFGRQVASGEFIDSDGTRVSVTINVVNLTM